MSEQLQLLYSAISNYSADHVQMRDGHHGTCKSARSMSPYQADE